MAKGCQNIGNLLEYFGWKSPSYYHSVPKYNYDPDQFLAYYLDMRPRSEYSGPLDASGLPLTDIKGEASIFPTLLIMYALGHLEKHRRQPCDGSLNLFRAAGDWLVGNQQADGSWPANIPKPEFGLKPPFPSAMIQGLAISVLTRAARLFESEAYFDSAILALKPFHREVSAGGVTSRDSDGVFYEEYPCAPSRHVLNGFIYAMWGLWDLVRANDNAEARGLWDAGLATLVDWLPRYDMGYWSTYHVPSNPCNPATVAYHRLHINQLAVMYAITEAPEFEKYRRRWDRFLKNRLNAIRTLPAKLRWLAHK